MNILDKILLTGIFSAVFFVPLILNTPVCDFKTLFFRFILVLLMFFYAVKVLLGEFKLKKSFLLFPVFLYSAAVFYSFLISNYQQISRIAILKYLTFLFLFFIVILNINRSDIDKILFFWGISAFTVSCCGIFQVFYFHFFGIKETAGRIFSTMGNPNFLSGYLTASLPVVLNFVAKANTIFKKVLNSFIVLLISVCIILTLSKSGIIILFAVFFIYGIFYCILFLRQNKFKKIFIVFLAVLAAILIFSFFFSNMEYHNFVLRPTVRPLIWSSAFKMVLNKPVLGYGLGMFPVYFPLFRTEGISLLHPLSEQYIKHAHNHLLEFWIEAGIIGLIALIGIWLVFLFSIIKFIRYNNDKCKQLTGLALFVSLISIIFMNFVNVDVFYTTGGMLFWLILSLIFILINDKNKKEVIIKSINLKMLISLVLIFFSLVLAGCSINSFSTRTAFDSVNQEKLFFLINNKTNEDFSVLNEKVKQGNYSLKDIYSLGTIYAKKRDWIRAEKYLSEFLNNSKETHPFYIKALNNLGNVYAYTNDLKKAIELYEKAIKLDSNYVNSTFNVAMIYFQKGKIEETVVKMKKVLELDPDNYEAKNIINNLGE